MMMAVLRMLNHPQIGLIGERLWRKPCTMNGVLVVVDSVICLLFPTIMYFSV